MSALPLTQDRASYEWVNKLHSVLARSFWVVQQHLDCQVHHLDDNGIQLFTTWRYGCMGFHLLM